MEFKELEWHECTWYRRARTPFGLILDIRDVKGKHAWDFGDEYKTFNKGACSTLERAKVNCERAYHKYVEDNLALCTLDS